MGKEIKTNAMRYLDQKKIPYQMTYYDAVAFTDGVSVARKLNQSEERTFKTLVTKGKGGKYYVFVLPVLRELDLKKGAKTVEEKNLEMLPVKDITAITGYVRGGCSPIGMKKQFPTVIDKTALKYDQIFISGGRLGAQITIAPNDLAVVIGAKFESVTKEDVK